MHVPKSFSKLAWAAILCLAFSAAHAAESGDAGKRRTALAAPGTPIIDGEMDDIWNTAPAISIRTPVAEMTSVPAGTAATGKARILWDQKNLYFLIDVQDTAVSTANGNPWEQDSVEIFLDENLSRRRPYDGDDVQNRISARELITGGGKFDPKRIKAAVRRHTDGYMVEVQLQPARLKLAAHAQLGLELQVNDDPGVGARKAIMKWSDASDNSWHDTSGFGTLVLREEISAEELAAPEETSSTPAPRSAAQRVAHDTQATVPGWARDAVFYQIFPERFWNGDRRNDPTRDSLEFPGVVPPSWTISPWTGDWYARADWERQMGDDFYDDGVFHRRYGGDLKGVLEKLDYVSDLGINVIYFNPVFYARSLHKYDGNSFHHVDPYFGPAPQGDLRLMAEETGDPQTWRWTAADKLFLQVLRAAHQRGIRVIIDGVFNHTGRDFFAFENLRQLQQDSPYKSWYIVEAFDDPRTPDNEFQYKGWWGVDTLPEFANTPDGTNLHPGPKDYIMAATRRWMDPNGDGDPADGIDGWRLDVANEVPNQFWVEWHEQVRSVNPEAYTVAEIWTNAADYLRDCGFSATMNYHGFAFLVKGFLIDNVLSPSDFARQLDRRRGEHHPRVQYVLQNLLDSHDTDRLASMIVNARQARYLKPERFDYDVSERVSARQFSAYDVSKPTAQDRRVQRLAALFQMTYVGAPMIYYGTEAGMWGGDDPCDRMPMVWPNLEYETQSAHPRGRRRPADTVGFDQQLFTFYKEAIQLRRDSAALRRGDFRMLLADDDADVIAFLRKQDGERRLVILNRSLAEQLVTIPLGDDMVEGQVWQQVFATTGEALKLRGVTRAGQLDVTLPPLFGAVLAPSS